MTALFPAEWSPQSLVLLAWPDAESDWRSYLDLIETTYLEMVSAISQRQPVAIACRSAAHQEQIEALLAAHEIDLKKIRFAQLPYNDTWVRDTAPLTALHQGVSTLLNFRFNAWGGKYECEDDSHISQRLWQQGLFGDTPFKEVELVLEGGAVESDGHGTLLANRPCLLAETRNPQLSEEQVLATLNRELGIERFLWITEGHLEGDDTDGHIDTLVRFCNPHTLAYCHCDNKDDPHFEPLQKMEQQLREFRDFEGNPYRLIPLPLPAPIFSGKGERLPATYANFLIINGAVLLPTYEDANDGIAMQQLREAFPDREIIPIQARPLILQYGSVHCATMQFPVLHNLTDNGAMA